jgi:uncharacterized membrane protein YeaQ/YmgE (transglycosylase-associated protein family)
MQSVGQNYNDEEGSPMVRFSVAVGAGALLQAAMVILGHFSPAAQHAGLFPVLGTLIGLLTGWLCGPAASNASAAGAGAVAGCLAGVIGSLISTALGDVPLGNLIVAGGATLVAGAIGALVRRRFARVRAPDAHA